MGNAPASPTLFTHAILLALSLLLPTPAQTQTYTISTYAGGALPVNVPGPNSSLYGPQPAIAADPAGNLFFADGNTILRLDAVSGLITLAAGNGTLGYSGDNGPATSAQLHNPNGVALDSAGNLYIASFYDNVVRKVSAGVITTIVGTGAPGFSGDNGPAISARLNTPYGIALDSAGDLYIADYGNSRIREVSAGVITTIAGNGTAGVAGDNGPAINAQLSAPQGVAVDAAGNIYIADCGNNRIRKVSAGVIGTVAGNGTPGAGGDNGPAIAAQLNLPCGVALDAAGNLYIADYYNNRVRKVVNGVISTAAGKGTAGFSGDNSAALKAQLNGPFAVTVDPTGNLYIADFGNDRIRKVSGGVITTAAGNGTSGFSGDNGSPTSAEMHYPYSIALDPAGDLYIADTANNRVRQISSGIVATVAGSGASGFSGDSGPASAAQLNQPASVAMDSAGNLYIADTANNRIRKISNSVITTVAGNGTAGFNGDGALAASTELNLPAGIALDSSGALYIADTWNHRIRKLSNGIITTVAGNGTPGPAGDGLSSTLAQLDQPAAIAVDAAGNLYIADTANNRIRKVSAGVITTVAGNGSAGFSGDGASAISAQLNAPGGIIVDSSGNLYIADSANNSIRKVSAGVISTIAGGSTGLGDGGAATSAALAGPQGIVLAPTGNIYIADTDDDRIRMLTPIPLATTSPSSLPAGTVAVAYPAVTFTAAGGAGGYTWSATGLPKGLTISTAGSLSGTPTVAATTTPQFTVKDSASATATSTLPLTIALPVPVVSAVSPTSATAYGAAFTLTVNGTGFATGAAILWNATSLTTKVVSATQATASVPATLIVSPASVTIGVISGGVVSDTLTFAINAPTPTITALSPATATATATAFTLTVTGTGFVESSQIQWNGAALSTAFVSATQLTASVPASLIASNGTATVTVNSGGTGSGSLTFTITAPAAISSLSPASVVAYGPAFTLTVNGTGFVTGATPASATQGSMVEWNNSPLTTKFVSGTQLTASVPANTIPGAGSVTIVVVTGGTSSNSVSLPVTAEPSVITSLTPASAIATGAAFTLTVNGTGFAEGTTVQWNGSALPTSYVSASELTAYVAASQIASAATASIVVTSGAVSSAAVKFPVTAPPAITTLSPAAAIAGGAGFTLTVNGTGFISGVTVQWNGAPLPTTFVSATRLTASVSASLIAGIGAVTIQANLSGASSAGVTLPISGPAVLTGLSPSSAAAGGAAFKLTVNGTGFVSGAAVTWNGTALTTKFVGATQLTAPVSATLIAGAGVATIVVNSSGVLSAASTFSINAPPVITTLSPATVAATGAAFTLTVNGTGFLTGAAIELNGVALTTTFVSSTQLIGAVPANLAAGTAASIVTVNPGGASSLAAKLSLTAVLPVLAQGSIVPIYSSVPVIQPGSWVSIYGTGLANGTYLWTGNFPTTLGGTTVTIDNKSAYLWSVSPTQINLQAPADTATGSVKVVVTTATGSTTSAVTLAAYGPSFSLLPASSYAAGVILTPGGTGAYGSGTYDLAGPTGYFSFSTRPVKSGETLELFGVGFGPTRPTVPPGKAFTGAAPTTTPVTMTIGGVNAQVLFSGITEAGLYQFNVVVPKVGSGDQPVLASVGSVQSPAGVLITVE